MDTMIIKTAREAGQVILRSLAFRDEISVYDKGNNDFVTKLDQRVEEMLVEQIRKSYPRDGIIAEESGVMNASAERVWIIDPLDGTRNFIQGIPHYAISVALRVAGVIQQGMVYDPIKDEMFTATKKQGAQLNSKKIRVGKTELLKNSIIGFGFPFRHDESVRSKFFKQLQALIPQCADVRRSGSAALDLAYVAAGRFDGFWEYHLNLWDIAAGALLVQEAGGLVADFDGRETHWETGNIVAGNPRIFQALLESFSRVK